MKNLHKFYYKDYFNGVNYNYLLENNKRIKEDIERSNKSVIGEKNKYLIEQTANNWVKNDERILPPPCGVSQRIEVQVQYPGLVSGIGTTHEAGIEGEFKLGVHFDYTHGMPVIYGSSVKGVLRSVFPTEKDKPEVRKVKAKYVKSILKEERFKDINVDKLRDRIFGGVIEANKDNGTKSYLSIYERDVFFDAVIIKPYSKQSKNGSTIYRIFESDSITPHGDNPLKNPKPVTFMKIASGVTLEFRFDLKESKIDECTVAVEDKIKLFKQILLDIGVGAKTNVGYGQFVDEITENNP